MAALASNWLRHFRLLHWNCWTELNETWQEARSQCPLPKFVFFGAIGKTRWPPWYLICWDIFWLLLWNRWTELNKTWQEARSQVFYQICVFQADRKNKMVALASDLLRHLRVLLKNRWSEFNETYQEARSQLPLPSLCFFGPIEKNKMAALSSNWLRHFSTSPLKPLNGIQRNLTGSKISTSSFKFVFFVPIENQRWPPWPLIGWDIFRVLLWNRWTEFH